MPPMRKGFCGQVGAISGGLPSGRCLPPIRRGNLPTGEFGTPHRAARFITPHKERGPSMYEMEGPRLAVVALACRLPGCRAPRGCHWPHASAAISGDPDLPASRSFPQVQHVFSGESSSTANPARHTRPLPAPLQDSLAVHRTSAVYPLCAAAFHRPIHMVIHSLGTTRRPSGPAARLRAVPQPKQRKPRSGPAMLGGRADRRAAPKEDT
jgi:hypothetical protein